MLLSSSLIGIFLSVILLTFNRKNFGANIYLGFFFLSLSIYAFCQYILLYSKSVFLITFFLHNFASLAALPFLIGPMLYCYIRSVLSDDPELKITDGLHLLPMLVYFLVSIPQNCVPLSDIIINAISLLNNTDYIAHFKGTPLSGLFTVEAIFLSRPGLVLIYTLWSVGLFVQYSVRKDKSGVFSGQHFMTKWLFLLLGFLLLLVVTQILSIARAFNMDFSEMFFTLNIVRLLSGLGLIGILISPFFFPTILYGLPRIPESKNEGNTEKRLTHLRHLKKNPNNNHFEDSYLHSIGQKADACMKQHKPYLEPDCNLNHLAKHVNLPVHHLAYYFKEVKKQHFTDYRNEWRINHAKNLIREGKASEITLEAIGMLSGFTSRNSFITDFKKMEGVSPGAYAARYN
jgi:AraC-like DNA-binding protein